MKKITVFALALVAFASFGCVHKTQVNGPNGPEYEKTEGPLGGSTTITGGPTFNDCMKYANIDPRYMPMDKYMACRGMMPGGGGAGGGMYGPGVQIVTPYQSGMMMYPGSAAISGPPPAVYGPSTGGTTGAPPSNVDAKIDAVGEVVKKHDLEICKLKKQCGK